MISVELGVNIIGWAGALALLAAYLLISSGKTHGKSYLYQGLNIFGCTGFIINSGYFGALPSVGLNVVWLGIGIYTSFTIYRKTSEARNEPGNKEI